MIIEIPPTPKPVFSFCLLIIASVSAIWTPPTIAQTLAPPFSPEHYQTVICFPDDWQKTMVNERGALAYDFGPGPYARPMTEISVAVAGESLGVDTQRLDDARIPVIRTTLRSTSGTIRLTSFALVPRRFIPFTAEALWDKDRIRRVGGLNGCVGWALPPDTVDPAFRNAAWGTNRPILYRVAVEPGSSRRVAMGICEPYKGRAGLRSLDLRVEGASGQIVDPMASGVKNTPQVVFFDGTDTNNDGWLAIECHAAGPDPNIFLNAFWVFAAGEQITGEQVLKGEGSRRAAIMHRCGTELERLAPSPRADAIIAEFPAGSPPPRVFVKTRRALSVSDDSLTVAQRNNGLCLVTGDDPASGTSPYLFSRPRPTAVIRTREGWVLEFPTTAHTVEIVVVHGNHGTRGLRTMPDLRTELTAARKYWTRRQSTRGITVPDPAIQRLVESSLRTVYQVRERVEGIAQFQPGPSVYRGLWIADAMLTGIPVAMMGDTASLRQYLDAGIRSQLPNGQVRSLWPAVSIVETPAWAFAAFWLAKATADRSWLVARWKEVSRALDWICSLRELTLTGPPTPYTGLLPAGFVDGGISTPMSDYGTLWWCMVALDEGIHAAEVLGDRLHADAWRSTFAGFSSSFGPAARRDIRKDRYGLPYLPVGVADTADSVPQRGQLSIFAPARFASFIDAPGILADSLARMNLSMMERYRCQGIYQGSGWMADGVWPWLGGYLGLVHQRIGDPARAAELLYAYADHASPTGVWVEEQLPRTLGTGTSGDVSDAEASAVFIHLVRYLLATERPDGLELLGGLPEGWLHPGATTSLRKSLTEFGWLTFELSARDHGAHLVVEPLAGNGSDGKPYLSTRALRRAGFTLPNGAPLPERISWKWREGCRMEFTRGTSR